MQLELQIASEIESLPDEKQFSLWAAAALEASHQDAELCIRIVDEQEGRELNKQYRGKDYATNVLSFPAELPEGVPLDILGDIIICAPVIFQEAEEQGKTANAHWAHMVVHGTLHLQGHDHQDDEEATLMEDLEIKTLAELGFANPYGVDA